MPRALPILLFPVLLLLAGTACGQTSRTQCMDHWKLQVTLPEKTFASCDTLLGYSMLDIRPVDGITKGFCFIAVGRPFKMHRINTPEKGFRVLLSTKVEIGKSRLYSAGEHPHLKKKWIAAGFEERGKEEISVGGYCYIKGIKVPGVRGKKSVVMVYWSTSNAVSWGDRCFEIVRSLKVKE